MLLVEKLEGKRPNRRPRHRLVGSIKMDLRETGWSGMDWVDLAQDRNCWRPLMNTVIKLHVP
jgi:hypothetical protein